ncbi:hypothetical protein [Rubrivirga sp. IMCC45206]|uniref:hypothetical protein n=1 Tax=Rubrivirga sp. IMCC45206 TaxID=3391614 RepID=UPI00398FE3B7
MPPPATPDRPAPASPAPEREPSLRRHLAARWRTAPAPVRWVLALTVLAFSVWPVLPRVIEATEGPSDEEVLAEAARARAQWALMRSLAPETLTLEPAADALGPGDAERADDRFADYYVHTADSVAFSILVTSDDFAPDLAVELPDGRTVAASNLLRTATRAEIDGLQGPGRFVVVVTSRRPRATGRYELAVVPAGPADSVYVDDAARLDTLAAGPLRAGRYERTYGIAAGSDLPVVVRVVSSAFVPRVHLLGPNGEVRGAWRSVERSSRGDSLHGVVLRYLPGWDAAYRLIVTSEEPGAGGAFALDARTVPIRDVRADGGTQTGTLGDDSWVENGRYVDTYKFRVGDDQRATIAIDAEAFPPAFRLWTIAGRRRSDVAEDRNAPGARAVEYEAEVDAGEYYLEVTSGGPDSTRALGGDYRLTLGTERFEPPPTRADSTAPGSRVFSTEVRRTGESGGSRFEVGVTNVAVSYPAGRTRVQLSVTVRSIDYTGNWAPWESFARKGYVVDGDGRRYTTSVAESQSPSGPSAEPGTARRGIVVFYRDEVVRGIDRLVFVAPLGGDNSVTLPINF